MFGTGLIPAGHRQSFTGSGAGAHVVAKSARILPSHHGSRRVTLAIHVSLVTPGLDPVRLVWTDRHPDSVAGCGVLRYKNRKERLDAETFRKLRDEQGAKLMTNHPARIRRALGVPNDEPGIEEDIA